MSVSYLRFVLQIECTASGYCARVQESPWGQARELISLPFTRQNLETFVEHIGHSRGVIVRDARRPVQQDDTVRNVGTALFNAVIRGGIRECLNHSLEEAEKQGKQLRLELRLEDMPPVSNGDAPGISLSELPWEYLCDETGQFLALSRQTPIVRYPVLPGPVKPMPVTPPLRVLAIIASPEDYPRLDVEGEWRKLEEALQDEIKTGRVVLEPLKGATLPALLQRLEQGDYHVLHFIGHGDFDEQRQIGVLVLEDASRLGRMVSAGDFNQVLADEPSFKLAVLNMCNGARTSAADPFAGVAQSLVRQGIPAVIGMQFEISDAAAKQFAAAFYHALADNAPVDDALTQARRGIFAHGNGVEWGTPVLYLRAPDGRIFDVTPAPIPSDPFGRALAWLRRVPSWILIASTMMLLVGMVGLAYLSSNGTTPVASARMQRYNYSGPCPTTFTFTASIAMTRPGTVTYHWDGSRGPTQPETVTFETAGSKTVQLPVNVATSRTGWIQLRILDPNEAASERADVALTCS